MTHYICKGGCKGISETSGTCQTGTCASFGHELEECACEDGRHNGAFEEKTAEEGSPAVDENNEI